MVSYQLFFKIYMLKFTYYYAIEIKFSFTSIVTVTAFDPSFISNICLPGYITLFIDRDERLERDEREMREIS